jgi:hypothetical protein
MEFRLPKRSWMTFLIGLILVLTDGGSLHAQDPTGRIVGTTVDPQGAGLTGVEVTVTNVTTRIRKRALTDNEGYYKILDLPMGTYNVTMQR